MHISLKWLKCVLKQKWVYFILNSSKSNLIFLEINNFIFFVINILFDKSNYVKFEINWLIFTFLIF